MKTENGTEGQPQVGCDAVFSPLAVCRESMQPGELYLWKRNKTVEVVKLNEPQDGFLVMGDDFPDYEEWYFDDELVGSLFGPVRLGENDQAHLHRAAKRSGVRCSAGLAPENLTNKNQSE